MSKVFVFESVTTDISSASVYGEIVYLWEEGEHRPGIFETDIIRDAIANRLHKMRFNPNADFFCVVGPMIPVVLTITVLDELYDTYKLLFWNAENREYSGRIIKELLSDVY